MVSYYIPSQFESTVVLPHGFQDMNPHRLWGHDLDFLGSRDVIGHVTVELAIYMVSYRWSFETNPISHMVAEILYVKHSVKRIPTENALSIFFVFWGNGKTGVIAFFNFEHTEAPQAHRVSH